MPTNYKQIFAIKNKNRDIIKKLVPDIQDKSGIYILTRFENGFKYGYIGQATVSVWTRLAEHLSGYQHIDLSIKNHGWYSPAKGYYDGVKQGQKKATEQVRTYFDKYLDFAIKPPTNKIKERKAEEFKKFLEGEQ